MKNSFTIQILPYSAAVGQEQLKLALELSYVSPRIGGVLLSGERGTGKSTIVRAFSKMIYNKLPTTIPINATEDRVIGGWKIDALMKGKPESQAGLIEEADKSILYIDEVNLLDDYIVNIILDVTSTGVLEIQREGRMERFSLDFTLIGTMNPEEGGLRPQLLDRFGLMVNIRTEPELRKKILGNVLCFDEALALDNAQKPSPFFNEMDKKDKERQRRLRQARENLPSIPNSILDRCVNLASKLEIDGHRGERILALAAQAYAAIRGERKVGTQHVRKVAPMALQHRLHGVWETNQELWANTQEQVLDEVLS